MIKPRPLAHSILSYLPAVALVATALAVSDTWTGSGDGNFANPANWLGGNVPGTPGLITGSLDVATFSSSANTAIALGGDRNLLGVAWDNSAPGFGAFSLGGDTLSFTTAGTARINGMWGASTQTINSTMLLNGGFTAFADAGNGGLIFAGPINNALTTGTTTIALRSGLGGAGNVFTGGINNNGSGLLALTVAASSTGLTTLGGTNTFTGALTVANGRLLIDDTAGNAVLAAAMPMTLTGAMVEFRGAASGASSESYGTLTVSENSVNRVVLNPNGGAGITVQVGGLTSTGGALAVGTTIIEPGANSFFQTAAALPVATAPLAAATGFRVGKINDIVLSSSNGTIGAVNSFRASYLVQDASGLGFATQDVSNNLVRYTDYSGASFGATLTAADQATSDVTRNYTLDTSLTRTAAFSFMTLKVDTAPGAIVLDMGANQNVLAAAGEGRGILITGANNFTITGTGTSAIQNSVLFHNYGTGTTTIDVIQTGALISTGSGLTVLNKTTAGGAATGADVYIGGGILRFFYGGTTLNYTNNILRIYDGGVLEIGADLNSAGTAGDFSRAISLTGAISAGQLSMGNDTGGFSAFGADRTVSLSTFNPTGSITTTNANLTWSMTNFVGGAFVLSSPRSNATLIFTNALNLAGGDRVFDVRNGSADIDARLTGALTNATVGVRGGFYKDGAGTLEITNAGNTYDGGTRVAEGRLLVSGSLTGTTAVMVEAGGIFQLGASEVLVNSARVKLEGGTFATGGFSETVGVFTLAGTAALDFGTSAGSTFQLANSSAESWSGALSITNWSGSPTGGGADQLFFGSDSTGLNGAQLALVSFIDPFGFAAGTYAATQLGTGELVPIPEPSCFAILGVCVMGLGLRRRRVL